MFINEEIANIRLMDLSIDFLEAFFDTNGVYTYRSSHDVVCIWMGH